MLRWIYAYFLYFKFIESANFIPPEEETKKCFAISEENLKIMRNLSENLETFSKANLQIGQQQLKKILDEVDESIKKSLKIDEKDSLESILLQHQLLLHQEMKEMFTEFKTISSRQKRAHTVTASKNDIYVDNDSKQSEKTIDLKDNKLIENKLSELSNMNSVKEEKIYAPTDTAFRPSDCSELLVSGYTESGIYFIYPFKCHCSKPIKVFCDMETDGGGWTVFLKRSNVSKQINFTRNWESYKNGFGLRDKEFWLGNEALHTMTSNRNYVLRLEAGDNDAREIWGEWNSIVVHSEEEKYKLVVNSHNVKSTAFDRFAYVTQNFFSTFDSDNDKHATLNCAQNYRGGWWYNACHHNNPTGEYGRAGQEGISINPWSKTDKIIRQAAWLQLKIRPLICSSRVSVIQFNKHNCALN